MWLFISFIKVKIHFKCTFPTTFGSRIKGSSRQVSGGLDSKSYVEIGITAPQKEPLRWLPYFKSLAYFVQKIITHWTLMRLFSEKNISSNTTSPCGCVVLLTLKGGHGCQGVSWNPPLGCRSDWERSGKIPGHFTASTLGYVTALFQNAKKVWILPGCTICLGKFLPAIPVFVFPYSKDSLKNSIQQSQIII